jgi:hypothetical protein
MWIMSGADLIASYVRHAASCLNIALRTTDEDNRASLLNLAEAWLILAGHAQKRADRSVVIVSAATEERPGRPE